MQRDAYPLPNKDLSRHSMHFFFYFFLEAPSPLCVEMVEPDPTREIRLIRLDSNLIRFDFVKKNQTNLTQSDPDLI
jgi:hypothetical protein